MLSHNQRWLSGGPAFISSQHKKASLPCLLLSLLRRHGGDMGELDFCPHQKANQLPLHLTACVRVGLRKSQNFCLSRVPRQAFILLTQSEEAQWETVLGFFSGSLSLSSQSGASKQFPHSQMPVEAERRSCSSNSPGSNEAVLHFTIRLVLERAF